MTKPVFLSNWLIVVAGDEELSAKPVTVEEGRVVQYHVKVAPDTLEVRVIPVKVLSQIDLTFGLLVRLGCGYTAT